MPHPQGCDCIIRSIEIIIIRKTPHALVLNATSKYINLFSGILSFTDI